MSPLGRRLTILIPIAAACYHAPPEVSPIEYHGQPAVGHEVINASVRVALDAAAQVFLAHGLLAYTNPDTNYVAAGFWDPALHNASLADVYPPEQRRVLFLVKAAPDTLGRGALVAVFALYRPFNLDPVHAAEGPAELFRGRWRAVPKDHPGVAQAQQLLEEINDRVLAPPPGGTH